MKPSFYLFAVLIVLAVVSGSAFGARRTLKGLSSRRGILRRTATREITRKRPSLLASIFPAWTSQTPTREGRGALEADDDKYNVAVIGAGMSGLAAASTLREAGHKVTVYEARNRIGGRIHTARELYNASVGGDIDLGASWIHGAVPENPLVGLRDRAGIKTVYVDAATTTRFYSEDGVALSEEYPEESFAKLEELGGKQLSEEAEELEEDIPLMDSLVKVDSEGYLEDPGVRFQLTNSAEFDLGAPLRLVSAKYWDEDELISDRDENFPGGYAGILTPLLEGLDIKFGAQLSTVEWKDASASRTALGADQKTHGSFSQRGSSTNIVGTDTSLLSPESSSSAHHRDGDVTLTPLTTTCTTSITLIFSRQTEPVCVDKVIITVPLGVLKSKSITFNPPLPASKSRAIDRIGFGLVNKVCVFFSRAFWPTERYYFGAVSTDKTDVGLLRTWISHYPSLSLMTVAVGDNALSLESMSDDQVRALVSRRMRSMFGQAFEDSYIVKVVRSGWANDAFARGSYAYPAVGIDDDNDWYDLEFPLGETVLFSGEATHREYRSTVHGAYLSGVRASERIIEGDYERLSLSDSLSSGEIAGIVIGSIALLSLIIGAAVFCIKRKREKVREMEREREVQDAERGNLFKGPQGTNEEKSDEKTDKNTTEQDE